MSLNLFLARRYVPAWIRRKKLDELLRLTARAFEAPPPPVRGLPFEDALLRYAEFSRDLATRLLEGTEGTDPSRSVQERGAKVMGRLFVEAYRFGQGIRDELGVFTPKDIMRAARVLYRGMDIDFQGDAGGGIVIRECYFSRFYDPRICRLMSSVDEGVLAGLAGGGRLEFTARLTEGSDCCRAGFSFPEAVS
jgi:hypothetical protein